MRLIVCHASVIRITGINLHDMIINNKKKVIHLDQVVYFIRGEKLIIYINKYIASVLSVFPLTKCVVLLLKNI